MQNELEKINKRIKSTWLSGLKIAIFLGLILAVLYFFMGKSVDAYVKEYESTTWYETKAVLERSDAYTVKGTRTVKRGGKKKKQTYNETYYTWYYSYEGKDGEQYQHTVDKQYSEGVVGDTIMIYVDEKDASHSLDIVDVSEKKEENWWIIKVGTALIIGPYVFAVILITIVLLIRRGILVKKMKHSS